MNAATTKEDKAEGGKLKAEKGSAVPATLRQRALFSARLALAGRVEEIEELCTHEATSAEGRAQFQSALGEIRAILDRLGPLSGNSLLVETHAEFLRQSIKSSADGMVLNDGDNSATACAVNREVPVAGFFYGNFSHLKRGVVALGAAWFCHAVFSHTSRLFKSLNFFRRGRSSSAWELSSGRVHNARVGSLCSGGNIAAAVVLAIAAVCSLGGCAPAFAKGAPLSTPDIAFYNPTTRGLAGGPVISKPADVREPAAGK